MTADRIARTVETLPPSARGFSYRIEMDEHRDGRHFVSLLVLDDRTGAKWAAHYRLPATDYAGAQMAKAQIAERLRFVQCLPCGSPLLGEEVDEHRGVCCYGCGDKRRNNGGRWP